jgi:branched-chain amino acid transport system permease protein
MKSNFRFYSGLLAALILLGSLPYVLKGDYFFFAALSVLQFVVMATAWNILGGNTGYVNFGSAAFFAIGAYSTVAAYKLFKASILFCIVFGTLNAALIGLAMGYLTLRLKGVFFSIATLALSVVLLTIVVNTDFLGGARGVYVVVDRTPLFGLPQYIHMLYWIMLLMSAFAIIVARTIQHSGMGRGLSAIRDDEGAAECLGVPTLKLKLIATTISGGLMGLAGTTFPFLITYVDPTSTFNLSLSVNSIAMPLIGGMSTWLGPVIGALLLGGVQQIVTVTVSSAGNLLIVGVLLVVFVILAPNGIVGWVDNRRKRKK